MRPERRLDAIYRYATKSKQSMAIYDFSTRLEQTRRDRRVTDLKCENALLARVLRETESEVARLRELLASS
jgi:hypothetical protein